MSESNQEKIAIFAGGCFWCIVAPFEVEDGVISVTAGYINGHKDDPTYKEVCTGETGHAEAIKVIYQPEKISYEKLLEIFWRQIDPTDEGGQFADRGNQYRTGIYYTDENQKKLAQESKEQLSKEGPYKGEIIVTEIEPADRFYDAEDYHQGYHKTNTLQYYAYRNGSGRDQFLNNKWKK